MFKRIFKSILVGYAVFFALAIFHTLISDKLFNNFIPDFYIFLSIAAGGYYFLKPYIDSYNERNRSEESRASEAEKDILKGDTGLRPLVREANAIVGQGFNHKKWTKHLEKVAKSIEDKAKNINSYLINKRRLVDKATERCNSFLIEQDAFFKKIKLPFDKINDSQLGHAIQIDIDEKPSIPAGLSASGIRGRMASSNRLAYGAVQSFNHGSGPAAGVMAAIAVARMLRENSRMQTEAKAAMLELDETAQDVEQIYISAQAISDWYKRFEVQLNLKYADCKAVKPVEIPDQEFTDLDESKKRDIIKFYYECKSLEALLGMDS